jgi:predicted phage terminase large subunit-like protein
MGSITGFGAGNVEGGEFGGCIIIDDPLKPEEAYSDLQRKKANDRLNNTILSRRNNPSKTPIIIIMQRLHEDDMSGFCLNGGTGEEWHHLSLPAIMDDGQPLWSAKHSLDQLETMKKADRRAFAGQYMQAPAPDEGAILKRQFFKTYRELPARVDKYLISLDATFKGSDKSDYVVMQAWAKCSGEYYLMDQVRAQMDFPATIVAFRAFCLKHPKCTKKLIEAKANGQAIIDSLKREISGIVAVVPKDSKESRVNAVTPFFEAGNVFIIHSAPWLNDFIEECAIFPNGKHDDQVDAMTQALIDFSGASIGSFTDEMLSPTLNNNSVSKGKW